MNARAIEQVPMPNTLKLGLRFDPRDKRRLHMLADKQRLIGDTSGLLDRAAEAADEGEPLIVVCDDPSEVEGMAYYFSLLGVERPVIEELNG